MLLPAIILAMFVGSELGVVEAKYQPMKIAAAEAQWNTCQPCSFSLFQIGGGKDDETPTQIIEIPHLLSLLATNHWNGAVEGLNQVNAQYQQQYGPGNYVPNVFIQYWSMRVMAYIAALVLLLALWGAWAVWRHRLERSRWFLLVATWAAIAPFFMNTAGWLLTENGRQPWIVQGLHARPRTACRDGERHLDLDHPDRVHPGLRSLRRRRRRPDGPLRAPGACPRARRSEAAPEPAPRGRCRHRTRPRS